MLQNTVNTYAYKKYGLVTLEETVDHVRKIHIITWLRIFQDKLLWKLFIQPKIQKFRKFLKVHENSEVVEFPQCDSTENSESKSNRTQIPDEVFLKIWLMEIPENALPVVIENFCKYNRIFHRMESYLYLVVFSLYLSLLWKQRHK